MATTYRKATVSLNPGEEAPSGPSARARKHRSASNLDRQGTPSARRHCPLEIVVPLFAVLADTAAALHAQSGGSTVSVAEGNLLGRSRFAVAIYPKNSVELPELPTRDLLFAFALLNTGLLLRPDHALGTWVDSWRKLHILDVVVCPASVGTAIRLGNEHGQEAIFDLKKAREILLLPAPALCPVELRREEN